ncbi:MAG: hypothetical protein ACLU4J_07860 [Butyricimonas paravirosa]
MLEGTSLDFYIEDNIVVIKAKTEQSVRVRRKSRDRKGKWWTRKTALPGLLFDKGTTLGVTTGLRVIFRSWSPTRLSELVFFLLGWYLKQFL